MGPELMNCCKLEPMGTQEFGKMVRAWESPSQRGKELENRGREENKEYQRLINNFEMEGLMAQKKAP